MRNSHYKIWGVAALIAVGAAGFFIYTLVAQQAAPQLAQGPLNTSRTIQPAFIMAVDDSGSMDFETLFPTNDGAAWWHSGNDSFIGLDRDNNAAVGVLNFNRGGGADNTWKKYPYLFPFGNGDANDGRGNGDATNDHFAIPPIPAYGWARSPDINKSYFEPEEEYKPWIEADGRFLQGVNGIDAATGQVSPGSAPADPKRGTTRLNLTSDFTYSGTNSRFMFHGGMTIPQGTWYKDVVCNNNGAVQNKAADDAIAADGQGFRQAQASRLITGADATARCNAAVRFFPATFYVLSTRSAAVAANLGYKPAEIIDDGSLSPQGEALRRFQIRPANFVATADYTKAINNFANWFSYYRKRHQAARAGLTLAFADQNLKIRAGYFQINDRNTVAMQRMNVAADRSTLYGQIFGLKNNGGTPNKEAVHHMGGQFRRAYAKDVSPVQLSCQKNFGMLFTDGFSNNATPLTVNTDNEDAVVFPAPLKDSTANTMADIAAYYYKNSLGTGFPPADGKVAVDAGCSAANPDPRLDCQTIPHMNFYGVTLGAKGLVYGNAGFENQTRDPFVYPPTWPTQFYDRHPSAVDDLWHAALNTRGKFINASTSGALVQAIQQVVAAVTAGSSTSGSIAVTGSRIGTGSLTVEPFYEAVNSTDWYGKLTARVLAAGTSPGTVTSTLAWEAGKELPAHGVREIHFGQTGNSVVPTVREFNTAGLTEAGVTTLAGLCADTLSPAACTTGNLSALGVNLGQAVNYLRGDASLEGAGLRERTAILGDIINSTPVVSAPIDDYGYRALGGTLGTSYATYLKSKAVAGNSVVLVGANDGMLHAFDGADGVEKFAYIPATSLGHLGNLLFPRDPDPNSAQKFDHRYYVDGPTTVSDVQIGGNWKTVLVGTSGAGGRSVFALDITDPDNISVLWEINDLITGNTGISQSIGFVLGKPAIVPVKAANGTVSWKVVFGNGYNSASQSAKLFVVDVGSGATQTISAVESTPTAHNGLGNLIVLDRQRFSGGNAISGRDGYADTVYAGDKNGAVWKFDIVNGAVALDGEPLYIAKDASGNRQPILGGLEAAQGAGGSVMIYFGTGSFSFENDGTTNNQQTLYGVMDKGASVVGRSALLQQTAGTDEGGYRNTSVNRISSRYSGWYLDLPIGERFVGNPRVDSGIVFFPSYEAASANTDPCAVGGANWLYGLNALSGEAAMSELRIGDINADPTGAGTGAIKLNTGGTAPVKDVAVVATPRVSPLSCVPGAAGCISIAEAENLLSARCSMVVQVAGAPLMYIPRPCGRQSWRQVR